MVIISALVVNNRTRLILEVLEFIRFILPLDITVTPPRCIGTNSKKDTIFISSLSLYLQFTGTYGYLIDNTTSPSNEFSHKYLYSNPTISLQLILFFIQELDSILDGQGRGEI